MNLIRSVLLVVVLFMNSHFAFALKKPKSMKHEFVMTTDGLSTLVKISGKKNFIFMLSILNSLKILSSTGIQKLMKESQS
jgi:hypothetical protein